MSVLASTTLAERTAHAAARGYPNIVVILADDMGFGDLACQNPDSKIPTPNLDRLASRGMRFTDAHSPSSVCSPTRFGLLTGTYAWRSPLKQSVLWTWDAPLIPERTLTLGGMLRERGYSSACIGKWHLGWDWPTRDGSRINDTIALGDYNLEARKAFNEKVDLSKAITSGPTTRGFDYYFGDDVPNFAPYCFIENDRCTELPTVPKPDEMFGTPGPMVPGWKLDAVMPKITQKAVDFISAGPGTAPFNKKQDSPFFLYFPLTAPHTPIAPAAEFIGKSEAHRYGDYVYQVDWAVGQIINALERIEQIENTLIVFTSDNGSPANDGESMNGEPRSVLKYGHNPSHIYRGIKADIWEGGHRVPFIASWPERIPAGTVSAEPICHVDLMATCAEIVNYALPVDAAVDSYNLLHEFEGRSSDASVREAIVHHSIDGTFAIRQGKWKLILGRGSGGWSGHGEESDPPMQLYDMHADVRESKNLYAEFPEIVAKLEELLRKYQMEGRSVSRGT